ncbi:helix-hairpin-helix domain-containing protein [Micromonospora sp. WMMD1102]|uniref:helix-hairpin-helix domain-containing protein n=1 Tax=Micromonospora sp. WMMD1102 TaxID=3016105 RepID=UPI002415722D|nr:helix-hairpin-helix domain-containing protein [Micromonospora sp. WMMD1102]MDG4789269.1 helix-hairpin-helix domain-containing protein [Micromonospora sp. WMMD1102]
MSDDDEILVRQRLSRLLGWRATPAEQASAVSGHAGTGSGRSPETPVGSGPEVLAHPGPETAAHRGPETAAHPGALTGPGAFDPGRRGVKALAVLAVVVVLGAAGWAWMSRPRTEPVGSLSAPATVLAPTPPSSGSVVGGADEVVVAVAGKVRRPGLVRLPAGARVADALESAGGALPGVDVALLNLARKVTDGELILVGVTPPPGAAPAGAGAPAGAPGVQPGAGKVNLNTATAAQLDALPGVGPVLAQRIVAHREEHGGFRSVGDLRQVTGIGDARYEDLKDLVTV